LYQQTQYGWVTPIVITSGDSENGWKYTVAHADPELINDPVAVRILQNGFIAYSGLQYVYINPQSGVIEVSPNTRDISKIYGGFVRAIDPVTGGWIIGDRANSGAIVQRAVNYRNSIYTGGGDFITKALDAGAGVAAVMAAVGALAISGAGVGLANNVTTAVQTGGAVATDTATTVVSAGEQAATTVVSAGEQAATTVAENSGLLTTADGNVIDASLTQTPGVTTNAYIDYGLTPSQITPLSPVISLPQTPPNIPQSPQTPAPVNAPMSEAEQAAKLLKDQALNIATGAGSTLLKTLTSGGNATPQQNRNLPYYLQQQQQPTTQPLQSAAQSGSVIPIALIAALLTLLG
jgi:hypothetical protein